MITELGTHDNNVLFTWDLIGKCNLNCSYCYNKNLNKTGKICKPKLILSRLTTMKVPFEIELVGGEPTLHPDILYIIKALNKNPMCKFIEVFTNGNATLELYNDILNSSEILKICFSYHHEYPEAVIKKISDLNNTKTYILANLPLTMVKVNKMIENLSVVKSKVYYNKLDSNAFFKADYDSEIFNTIVYENDNTYNCIIDNKKTTITEHDIYKNYNAEFFGWHCSSKGYGISVEGVFKSERDNVILPLILNKHNFDRYIICPEKLCLCGNGFGFKKYDPNSFLNI